jgi:transcriptional regulator with XRE-family HTH domain
MILRRNNTMAGKLTKLTEDDIVWTMTFVNNLRFIMRNKRIGIDSLAKKIGVKPYEIQKYMRGSARPSNEFVTKAADALGCSVYDLIDENGNPRNFSKTEEEIAELNIQRKKEWEERD